MANPNAIVSRYVTAVRAVDRGAMPGFELEDGQRKRHGVEVLQIFHRNL